jgi:hypothetical protein
MLPFSVEIPKSWVKNGKWPNPPKAGDETEYQCGPGAALTVNLSANNAETQATVLAAYARAKKRHTDKYWPIKGQNGSGEMIQLGIPVKKGVRGGGLDWLAGKIYVGAHKSVFFEWRSTTHSAGPADRALVSAIIGSIKPTK